jgi:hypothetical protein
VLSTRSVTTFIQTPGGISMSGIAWGGSDHVYVCGGAAVYKVALSTGSTSRYAGTGTEGNMDNPKGLLASFTATSSMAVSECPRGYSANSSSGMCSQCTASTFFLAGSCVACPVGSSSDAGATACTAFVCPAGSYYVSMTVIPCPPGTYSTEVYATACTQCKQGTYSTATMATLKSTCAQCPAGTYASQSAAFNCSRCASGKYSSTLGGSAIDACKHCPAGTYAGVTGADACTLCPANSFCSPTRAIPCPDNSTSPAWSTTYLNCTCPAGTSGVVVNATHGRCALCAKGQFCQGAAAVCGC